MYKDIAGVVEQYAIDGVGEFYPATIKSSIDASIEDYMTALGILVDTGVLRRKFVTDVDNKGNYLREIPIREVYDYNLDEIFVKYEITDEFSKGIIKQKKKLKTN